MSSNIIYQFKKHGYQVEGEIGANSLYIDTGNQLCKGVIDHHHLRDMSGKRSQTSTVKVFDVSYLRHLINGNGSVVIYTHLRPDSDAILATYMADVAIRLGEEEYNNIFTLDKPGYKLVEYVDKIDSGKGKRIIPDSSEASFYVAICFLERIACAIRYYEENHTIEGFDYREYMSGLDLEGQTECDQLTIELGHKLIDFALEKLNEDIAVEVWNIVIDWSFIENIAIREYIKALYKDDHDKYLREKKTSINFEDISVWRRDCKEAYPYKLKAAVWRELPVSEFSYIYARDEDDAVITVVPESIKGKNNKEYTHVRISVDPESKVSDEVSLRPLVETLELMEQIEENVYYAENRLFIRDHSRSREGFDELPFAATSDPWFYTEDELLVEDPGKHSLMEYETIISILKHHTKIISSVKSREYKDGHLSNTLVSGKMTISKWIKKVSELVNDSENGQSYDMILTQIDPIMLKDRNDVLKALCMCVLGNNVFESIEVYEPDYYSCIYANEHYLLTMVAEDEEAFGSDSSRIRSNNNRRIYSLSDGKSPDELKSVADCISDRVVSVIKQRDDLFKLGEGIEKCVGNPIESRKLYAKYVDYLATEQRNSLISNYVEQEIYEYVRKMLRINEAKRCVQDTIDIVTTDSKERVYGVFNFLTAITVPFVIISTFFQMGMIQFAPLVSENGIDTGAFFDWIIVLCIAVIAGILLFRRGRK